MKPRTVFAFDLTGALSRKCSDGSPGLSAPVCLRPVFLRLV
jgi:hypothetical protein